MRLRKQNNSAHDIGREMAELQIGMEELGIAFERDARERFRAYLGVLYSYHGRVHLLSHQDYQRISRRHFLPSLVALPYVRNHKCICDIGSGAGFPSIPLKIVLPELDLVVFEAQRKKADFLRVLIEKLCLDRVDVVNARAEVYSGLKFDLALFRAVGKIRKLISVLDLLLQPGGEAIFLKSPSVDGELKIAASVLNKLHFTAEVKKISTPLERLPLALVILRRL